MNPLSVKMWAEREFGPLDGLVQGIAVATVIGITAQFLSEHYGAPAMLMALLLGIAFHFLAEEGPCVAGINFTARTVLRMGEALLGAVGVLRCLLVARLLSVGPPRPWQLSQCSRRMNTRNAICCSLY